MIKKGIFGGTFDPIHNGHLHIAYEALYNLNLDGVIFMPSGSPPHKTDKVITDAQIRYTLINEVIENEKKFEISDYEISKEGLSYTYETLRHFNELEPNTQWYFITGVDCLMNLYTWKNIDDILNSCIFVVFSRDGYNKEEILIQKKEVENRYKKEIIFLELPILDISSTSIREKIKDGRNVSYLLPEKAKILIQNMNIYR
jgi:nicotinate-nucleotide adenylyltransferase